MNKYLLLLLFLFAGLAYSQSISFVPDVDTLKIGGGCTPPQLTARITNSQSTDSVIIFPGFNTNIWAEKANPELQNMNFVAFIISDSGNTYNYQLKICPINQNSFPFLVVPFDSAFEFECDKFNLRLIVFENGNPVDSLDQFFITEIGVGIDDYESNGVFPSDYTILTCFPNPFNPLLRIKVTISQNEYSNLSVYNLLGQRVAKLYEGNSLNRLTEILWNAESLSSGSYYIILNTGQQTLSQKVILIK